MLRFLKLIVSKVTTFFVSDSEREFRRLKDFITD